jgi:hypothetical protein
MQIKFSKLECNLIKLLAKNLIYDRTGLTSIRHGIDEIDFKF